VRKLFILLPVVLLLAACNISSVNYQTSDGTLVNWRQNVQLSQERRVQLVVPAVNANSKMMYAVNQASRQANRSPYIHTTIHVPNLAANQITCSDHCVLITQQDLPYPYLGVTGTGWDSHGHMYGMASRVKVDVGMTQDLTTKVMVHEVFHAMALGHPPNGAIGPTVNGVATDWDLALIRNAHAHWDTGAFQTLEVTGETTEAYSLSAHPKKVWKTTKEDVLGHAR
jgi:hypothetical protein